MEKLEAKVAAAEAKIAESNQEVAAAETKVAAAAAKVAESKQEYEGTKEGSFERQSSGSSTQFSHLFVVNSNQIKSDNATQNTTQWFHFHTLTYQRPVVEPFELISLEQSTKVLV